MMRAGARVGPSGRIWRVSLGVPGQDHAAPCSALPARTRRSSRRSCTSSPPQTSSFNAWNWTEWQALRPDRTAPADRKLALDFGMTWFKGQTIDTGRCPVKKYNRALRDLIAGGRAHPGFVVSHELPLDRAPEAYRNFDRRETGWTKVVLHP